MPSIYNKDSQNAALFGDEFASAKVKAGTLSFGATATTDVLTHGLGAAPDFVIVARSEATGALTWAANTTSLTVTRAGSTTGAETWSYIVGILA